MIQQRARLPAILMLLAVIAFGCGIVWARRGNSNAALNMDLAKLQAAAAAPGARLEDWVNYGHGLQTVGRLPDAIVAYDQALKMNSYDRDARFGCGACKARLGNSQAFFEFIQDTNKVDPKTSKAILERPEAAIYLAEARFQTLKSEADAGAMD